MHIAQNEVEEVDRDVRGPTDKDDGVQYRDTTRSLQGMNDDEGVQYRDNRQEVYRG